MPKEMLDNILSVIPDVIKENPELLTKIEVTEDWYHKRYNFLNKNQEFLKEINNSMKQKYHQDCSTEELFYMQKLYLLYPGTIPKKLLSLSWEHIKCILNLCNYEKRKFYVDLCYEQNLDIDTLKEYIEEDIYEKYVYLIHEIADYEEVNKEGFKELFLEVKDLIYEEY